jgi:hypothetical protein
MSVKFKPRLMVAASKRKGRFSGAPLSLGWWGAMAPRQPLPVFSRARVAEVQVFGKVSRALHLHGGSADQDELNIRVEQGANRVFKVHFFDR